MGDSNRKQIIDYLVDRLSKIQKGTIPTGSVNAYATNVKSVVLCKDTVPEISRADLPQIQIWKGLETVSTRSGRQLFISWELNFMIVLTEHNEDATDDAIDEIRDDIIACMFQDISMGGAVTYKVELVETYEGVHEDVTTGQLRMLWRIGWHRNVAKS